MKSSLYGLLDDFDEQLKDWDDTLRKSREPVQESCVITVVGESGDPIHFVVLEEGETHMDSETVLSMTCSGLADILPSLSTSTFQLRTLAGHIIPPHTLVSCSSSVRLVPIKGRDDVRCVRVTYKDVPVEFDPGVDLFPKACDTFMVAPEDHELVRRNDQSFALLCKWRKKKKNEHADVEYASQLNKSATVTVRCETRQLSLALPVSCTPDTLFNLACRRLHVKDYSGDLVPLNDQARASLAQKMVVDASLFEITAPQPGSMPRIVVKISPSVVPPDEFGMRMYEAQCGRDGIFYRQLLQDVCTAFELEEPSDYELVHRSKMMHPKRVIHAGTVLELRHVSPNQNPF